MSNTSPRFSAKNMSKSDVYECWVVMDAKLQVDIFHWYGPTGRTKCEAVSAALNAVDDGSGD